MANLVKLDWNGNAIINSISMINTLSTVIVVTSILSEIPIQTEAHYVMRN